MLTKLTVRQFAIIDDITIDFQPGMTVLTGETGAGKSLLIDAIALILGDRASADMIRTGADRSEITAVFTEVNDRVLDQLRRLKAAEDGRIVTIYRDITLQNKNTIKINRVTVTLQQLRDVTKHLADVHSQFDTQRLINPLNYLGLIDGFKPDVVMRYLTAYGDALETYKQSLKAWKNLLHDQKDFTEKLEIYRFQRDELKKLGLSVQEKETLTQETKWMQNYDKVFRDLAEIRRIFEELNLLDGLYDIKSLLGRLGQSMAEFSPFEGKTNDAYYELTDLKDTIVQTIERLNFDPATLDRMLERLHQLTQVEKKYGKSIAELMDHQAKLTQMLDHGDDFDAMVQTARKTISVHHQQLIRAAADLTAVRKQIAKRIETELHEVFGELVLKNTRFEIHFDQLSTADETSDAGYTESGVDTIDFWISTNPGEPLKPLSKTVSGGEMSRVMLAFKTIFIASQQLTTMIFDEIDTGISGFVAKQIAKKIKSIAASCQVVSITHLPQVVGIADHHLKVTKTEFKGRTVAAIRSLGFEERVAEIAEMISGDATNESSLKSARELLTS